MKKCSFKKSNGEKCKAWAMVDSSFCFFHNPDISETEKKEAQRRGGQSNKARVLKPLEPITLRKSKDVVLLLEDTINKVRAGEMDLRTANYITYSAGYLIRAIEINMKEEEYEENKELFSGFKKNH